MSITVKYTQGSPVNHTHDVADITGINANGLQDISQESILDLLDVNSTAPTDGQALIFDNSTSKWVSADISVDGVDAYTKTETNTLLDAKVDDSQLLTNVPAGAIFTDTNTQLSKTNIDAMGINAGLLDGIDSTGFATSNQGILADSSLQNITAEDIQDLSNVNITSVSSGQVLKYNGTNWTNQTDSTSGSGSTDWGDINGTLSNQTDLQSALNSKVDDSQLLTNVPAGAIFTDTNTQLSKNDIDNMGINAGLLDGIDSTGFATSNQGILADSSLQNITAEDIQDLSNVNITSVSSGQVLKYNGTNWTNQTDSTSGSGSTDWGDINGTLSNQTDLQTALDSKSSTSHTHVEADITDLDKDTSAEVDSKVATKENIFTKNTAFNKNYGITANTLIHGNDSRLSDSRTPTNHSHTKSDITDFSENDYASSAQGILADSSLQNITAEDIQDLSNVNITSVSSGQVLKYNGTNWTNQTDSTSGVGSTDWGDINGTLSNQTDLQSALNSKVDDSQLLTNVPANAIFTDTNTQLSKNDIDAMGINAGLLDGIDSTGFSLAGHNHNGIYHPIITENTAFNKNYGITANTLIHGNDSRLSDSRTPTNHSHTKADISDFSDFDYATNAHTHPNAVDSPDVADIVILTQASYDVLTPVASTLYFING